MSVSQRCGARHPQLLVCCAVLGVCELQSVDKQFGMHPVLIGVRLQVHGCLVGLRVDERNFGHETIHDLFPKRQSYGFVHGHGSQLAVGYLIVMAWDVLGGYHTMAMDLARRRLAPWTGISGRR